MSQKILICDDEEGVRESLKLILEDHYELIVADQGEQCLECLKNNKDVALVFLDIKMPKIHGLDVLEAIKKNHPRVKVVMVTGYQSVDTASEATRRGASGYIVKPFKSTEILESAKRHLEAK